VRSSMASSDGADRVDRWKKVTTNVSNFIMGSPIIDHYGDLVVSEWCRRFLMPVCIVDLAANHRTGETCTLTFKPRSWRGRDAFEIKGSVQDGRAAWDIAGRESFGRSEFRKLIFVGWDTQLVARQAGADASPLEVDAKFSTSQKEYLLLWRNSEKPPAPFNLTPFAVTLVSTDHPTETCLATEVGHKRGEHSADEMQNDIPRGLNDYLCPTDCRLRTDQRAFENAEYDRAQE
jgi:hypothetical protein